MGTTGIKHTARTGVVGQRVTKDEVVLLLELENGDQVEVPLHLMHNQALRHITRMANAVIARDFEAAHIPPPQARERARERMAAPDAATAD